MRDHEKDADWKGITTYKYNEKLSFDFFISYKFIPKLKYYLNEYDSIKNAYEHEHDGRKKKTLLKALNKEIPTKKRFDDLLKEKKFREMYKLLGFSIDDFFCWDATQYDEDNKLLNNYGFVNIRGIDVEPENLDDFIRDFNDTVYVFKIKKPFNDPTLVFELMGGFFWTDLDNQEDGAEIEENLKIWFAFCKRVENGRTVIRNGYYNQSKQKALYNLENLGKAGSDQYWLLALIIEYEKVYEKQISFKPELIKKRRLIKLLEKWFSPTIIERLYKNLQK